MYVAYSLADVIDYLARLYGITIAQAADLATRYTAFVRSDSADYHYYMDVGWPGHKMTVIFRC